MVEQMQDVVLIVLKGRLAQSDKAQCANVCRSRKGANSLGSYCHKWSDLDFARDTRDSSTSAVCVDGNIRAVTVGCDDRVFKYVAHASDLHFCSTRPETCQRLQLERGASSFATIKTNEVPTDRFRLP
jgi:hypothetical protein